MKYLLMFLFLVEPLSAQTFSVIHKKKFWRDGRGRIEITQEGIAYRADGSKDSRTWKYPDIQYFDRISDKEFSILTYEDSRILLGRDKEYRFMITEGSLTDEIFGTISARVNKPVTNRAIAGIGEVLYELPAKHLHALGGCEGTLKFTDEAIYYITEHEQDAREWQLGRDIQSVWSADRFRIEIYAYDNNRREFSRTRGYRFDLKQPLDPEFYRKLKLKLYDLEAVHLPLR